MDMLKIRALGEYLEKNSISQNSFAKSIGISAAATSQYLSGKYTGDTNKIDVKADAWLKREKSRTDDLEIPTYKTINYKMIERACNLVHKNRDMGLIVGSAGVGKTYAVGKFTAENPNSILIKVDAMFTRLSLVQQIAAAIQLEIKGDFRMIFDHLLAVLKDRDTLIIIDEADYLRHDSLELLRNIHDKTNTGIMLVGINRLHGIISSNQNDHKQIESRLGVTLKLKRLPKNDSLALLENTKQVKIESEISDRMIKFAKGSVRLLTKLFHRAYESMKNDDDATIKVEHYEMAVAMMGGA